MKKLLLFLFFLPLFASARKFYFSTSGSDTYTTTQAQNSATPWQTLKKVQDLSRSLTFTAGDTLAFKCGDMFANGYDVSFGSMKWWNKPYAGLAAPSGTAGHPIVFMSYGTGNKPNFLFPLPETCCTTSPNSKTKHAMSFEGVSYLEFRDLQFNDTRFSYTDKVSTAYTIAGLQIGEFGTLVDPFRASADHIMVDNCYFANIGYGVACAGHYQTIQNCTFENFKSAGDTSGMTDIGSDAFYSEGWYNGLLKNNIFKGSWSYTNSSGTGGGKVGGHIEVLNQFDDNLIIYNTFIDSDGHMEFGSNLGSTFGANRDTFAYNKFINGSIIAYYHIGDAFGGTSSNQHYWNNVFVENDYSRMSGVRFGTDIYADGQSFAQFPGWPALPQNPVPVGYSSWRPIMYTTDAGIVADTLIDVRNNVFWCTKALQMKRVGTKIKYRNNIYRLSGGAVLGGTLDAGEISTASKVFVDTIANYPESWNYHLITGSPAIGAGVGVGISTDYGGAPVTNPPSIGIYNASAAIPTITTTAAATITRFTAVLGGNVTADGGLTVTERGVCWGTSVNPTIAKISNRLANGSGTGTFSTTISPFLPGTIYHVRAYAINSAGTAYGADVTFTTSAATANRGWYFSSSTGNDNTGNGTLASPYQTLIKLQNLITINNVTFQPGDSVLFKRGDVFTNGYDGTSGQFKYVSCSWIVDQVGGYTAPSGTAAKPIIITGYGVGAKPNFYFPTASSPSVGTSQIQHNIFEFAGVEYITIDGLNFIDTRWPGTNHSNPAYTRSALIFGEWLNGYNADPNVRRYVNNYCEVKNCRFENVSFAFGSVSGSYNKFRYDTMINMVSSTDTFGVHDVSGGAFDGANGSYNDFSYNYIESAWAKSGRNSSCQGMAGVAFNIFCLKNSRIAYNTIIDVRHAMEIGNLDLGDSTSGAQYDTFAFNKCIGMYQFGYLHGNGDEFSGNVHNISIWNNVLIENNSSRMSGPNFGYDRKGNGTNFNQFWFFGNKNLTTGYNAGYGNFTSGSNIVTGMTYDGNLAMPLVANGMVAGTQTTGSQIAGYDYNTYLPETPLAWVTTIPSTYSFTASQNFTGSGSPQKFIFFPPLNMKGITWSQPPNISSSGYYNSWDNSNSGNRLTVQYPSDNTKWGRQFDTLVDLRNNIFYNTTGMQMIPDGFTRFKHRNNAYYVKGGFTYTGAATYTNLTRMGGALGTNEVSTTAKLFIDTTAALPENWNLNPLVGSPVSNTGIAIPGFTTDFAGNTLSNPPSMGLYNSTPVVLGRKFHFSSTTGNDGYTEVQAQNPATPWKTLAKLDSLVTRAAVPIFAPGDTIAFKRGDVFANGRVRSLASVLWTGPGTRGWGGTAPSGTANNPIVFTSYGTGAMANLIYPRPATGIPYNGTNTFLFDNVGWLVFDSLQFNDTRFPYTEKIATAYTHISLHLGEGTSIWNDPTLAVHDIVVKNCLFSNTAYGIMSTGDKITIENNSFSNFKSSGDTTGMVDVGADALMPTGSRYLIKNNLIQGSWAYSGMAIPSSSEGKLGGGLESINDFDSSLVIYNTFFDNSGSMEFGANDGINYGPNDDTFAYNKFINNYNLCYVNVSGQFNCTAKNMHFWNNVIIENNNSRHSGPRFGQDVLGDGQSFLNWYYWPTYPSNASLNSAGRYAGYSDDTGVVADTLYDIRNNIFWNSTGQIMNYSGRTKVKYNNNLYRLSGGSSIGYQSPTDVLTTNKIFLDTSSINPVNWDVHLANGSPAINAGVQVGGVSKDWDRNTLTNPPSIGIYNAPPKGRRFYVSSSTGNDSYTVTQAQNSATPWKTLVQVQAFGPSALPGDTISFKCGDVFANGSSGYNSMQWWGPSRAASCASGTALSPILFNSYSTGTKPNMLYPYPTATARDKLVLGFSGVEYITVDGLQFNDTRFSVTDKVGTALTKTGIMLGEGTSGIGYCNNCTVKNCDFTNIGCGIEAAGNYQIIDSNTITNLKSWGDTSGFNDGGAMPIARSNGKHCRITHNYINGGWCFTGATASGQGLNGVGIEILNDFDSSFIGYNTIVDCAGGFEIGSQIGPAYGPDNDTFAYNKFINLGALAFAATNPSGAFGGTIRKLRFWNNVYVQNQTSRFAGPKFGTDIYTNEESFNQFPSWGNGTGISPGSYPYNSSRMLGNYNAWSVLAYNYDNGVSTDTVYDSRNNVFWMTAGLPILKTNASTVNLKRRNNIYHVAGSDSYPSILGPSGTTLSTGEVSTTAKLFVDTVAIHPESWDFHLAAGSAAVNTGVQVGGITKDYGGSTITNPPSIGLYNASAVALTVSVTTGTITCFGGSAPVTVTATGGTPPYIGTGTFTASAGTSSYTVIDAVGTSQTVSVTLVQPTDITGTISFSPVTTLGGTTTVTTSITGGTGAKTYSLDGGAYQVNTVFTGVLAGAHAISAKDANGCTHTFNFTVTYVPTIIKSRLKFKN